jgi:hypothetical protein
VPNPNTKEDDEHEEEEEEEENRDQDQIKATTDEDQLITAAVDSTSSPSITVKKEPLLVAVTSA